MIVVSSRNARRDGLVVRVGDTYYTGQGAMCSGDLQAAKVYRDPSDARDAQEMWERGGHTAELVPVAIARKFRWRTDAVSGEMEAADEHAVLASLIGKNEWAELHSDREHRDITNGAWLMIFDEHGVPVLRRGKTP